MIRCFFSVLLFAGLVWGSVCFLQKASAVREEMSVDEGVFLEVPAPLLRLSAVEFDGLLADYLLLRSMTFIGESSKRITRPQVKDFEWRQLYAQLESGTELDPYFFDLYYFAHAHLTWGGGMIEETNELLAKGAKFRDWDWMLPFFQGFNDFFFLGRYDTAADHLMESSRRPGGNPSLALFASRLALKGRRIENAILFMKELLRNTEDNDLRQQYQRRLDELEQIYRLEVAIRQYHQARGVYPDGFDELFASGLVEKPAEFVDLDKYYIDVNGEITARD